MRSTCVLYALNYANGVGSLIADGQKLSYNFVEAHTLYTWAGNRKEHPGISSGAAPLLRYSSYTPCTHVRFMSLRTSVIKYILSFKQEENNARFHICCRRRVLFDQEEV